METRINENAQTVDAMEDGRVIAQVGFSEFTRLGYLLKFSASTTDVDTGKRDDKGNPIYELRNVVTKGSKFEDRTNAIVAIRDADNVVFTWPGGTLTVRAVDEDEG